MAHNYLLDLYVQIENRQQMLVRELANTRRDPLERNALVGRELALKETLTFLRSHYEPLLPKRIRQRWAARTQNKETK